MSKLDDFAATIRKGVNKGVSVVKTTSKKMMAVTQLNNELKRLQQAREEKVREIGEKTITMVREGMITAPEIREAADAVYDQDRQIEEKKKELERVREAADELAGEQPAEVQKEAAPAENCGHNIPEGAKFCPDCGRKVP